MLRVEEHLVPEPGLQVALHLWQVKVGARPARDELANYLEEAGGQAMLRVVAAGLREKTPFFELLAAQGLSRRSPLDAFVALFPDVFEIAGSGSSRSLRLRGR